MFSGRRALEAGHRTGVVRLTSSSVQHALTRSRAKSEDCPLGPTLTRNAQLGNLAVTSSGPDRPTRKSVSPEARGPALASWPPGTPGHGPGPAAHSPVSAQAHGFQLRQSCPNLHQPPAARNAGSPLPRCLFRPLQKPVTGLRTIFCPTKPFHFIGRQLLHPSLRLGSARSLVIVLTGMRSS